MDRDQLALLVAELERDEGFRAKPYRDSKGYWTVGIGRLIDKRRGGGLRPFEAEGIFGRDGDSTLPRVLSYQDAPDLWQGRSLTYSEAVWLKGNDIADVLKDLDRYLPWWRGMSPVRQRVLANMAFNMGIGTSSKGLRSFRNTLAAMARGDYNAAANGMHESKWAEQVGERADRLIAMMRTG